MPCRWIGCVIIVSFTSTMRSALAVGEAQRLGVGELDAVERPGEALHVAGEVQLDRARRARGRRDRRRRCAGRRRSARGGRCRAGRCRDRRAAASASSPACRRADCPFRVAGCACIGAGHRPTCRGPRADPARRLAPAMRVTAVAHVGHGQQRARVERGHRRAQPVARGQRAARRSRCDPWPARRSCTRPAPDGLDDHVEGLGDGDAELVDRHRVHVLAVGGDDRHLQARECARRSRSSPSR